MLQLASRRIVELHVDAADAGCVARDRKTYPYLEHAAGLRLGEECTKVLCEVGMNRAGRQRVAGGIRKRESHASRRVGVIEPCDLYVQISSALRGCRGFK